MGELGNKPQAQGGGAFIPGAGAGGGGPAGGKGQTPGGVKIDMTPQHQEMLIRRNLLNPRQQSEYWHSDTATQRDFMKKASELSDEEVRKLANDTFGHAEDGNGPSGQGGSQTGAPQSSAQTTASAAQAGAPVSAPSVTGGSATPSSVTGGSAATSQGHPSTNARPSTGVGQHAHEGPAPPTLRTQPQFDPVPEQGSEQEDETNPRVKIG